MTPDIQSVMKARSNDTQIRKAGSDMRPTGKHLVGVAATLSAIAIAAPAATAGAVTAAPAVAPDAVVVTGWDGLPAASQPVAGQSATAIGPTFITSAPTTFINTNTQVSTGDNSAGGQSAP
jgi:hypothetical protein